ncbi:Hypothetical protein CAP_7841 [Chondromyces apiculatus DSM 436]|uniref:Uncharacterized protein n=1 Tax=Chondromyces apiculatus DSM 436 TaxID=1192034 RepID=A0A017SYS6_9BACT|nr:Hypothetical protein CAP_7841 [Chondromyces apiculatus DSM 436]
MDHHGGTPSVLPSSPLIPVASLPGFVTAPPAPRGPCSRVRST